MVFLKSFARRCVGIQVFRVRIVPIRGNDLRPASSSARANDCLGGVRLRYDSVVRAMPSVQLVDEQADLKLLVLCLDGAAGIRHSEP